MLFIRSFLLSLRLDGVSASLRRAWERLFGTEQWYVFVRHLKAPPVPVELPVESNGITVRRMAPSDIEALARLMPFDLDRRPLRERRERMRCRLSGGMVASRGGRIVGAAWYTDQVTPEQPWYAAVEKHIVPPARFTANIFAVPGEKGAAWTLAKQANEQLASSGVRTVVGLIRAENKPSIFVSRMLGGRIVARQYVRHRFGRTTTTVTAVADQEAFRPAAGS